MNKRIYRSSSVKLIAGVCGGLAEYFKIDVVLFRILFIVLTIGYGSGIIAYIVFWIMMPKQKNSNIL